MTIAISGAAILSALGDAVTYGPKVIAFVAAEVDAVEKPGQTGADKLSAVLNAAEAFVNANIPDLAAPLDGVMSAVEAFTNDLVLLYNEGGAFVKGLEKAL